MNDWICWAQSYQAAHGSRVTHQRSEPIPQVNKLRPRSWHGQWRTIYYRLQGPSFTRTQKGSRNRLQTECGPTQEAEAEGSPQAQDQAGLHREDNLHYRAAPQFNPPPKVKTRCGGAHLKPSTWEAEAGRLPSKPARTIRLDPASRPNRSENEGNCGLNSVPSPHLPHVSIQESQNSLGTRSRAVRSSIR